MQRLQVRFTGRVRNESDGSVLMQVQGPEDAVTSCLSLIPQKTFGRVDDARESPMSLETGEAGFEIRH